MSIAPPAANKNKHAARREQAQQARLTQSLVDSCHAHTYIQQTRTQHPLRSHELRAQTKLNTHTHTHTHLLQPRLGDFIGAALAHGAVLHHALPVFLPEGALQVQVNLVVLEEVSEKKGRTDDTWGWVEWVARGGEKEGTKTSKQPLAAT